MSEKLEKLMEELLEEQKRTSLYTLTLEKDRLLAALMQAGLGIPLITANEFSLAAGATTTIIQPVAPGFVYILMGAAVWYTSLPWWCNYNLWIDTTAPALPIATATRMPEILSTPDFGGVVPLRGFLIHQVTNNHVANHAYGMINNVFVAVAVETWDMIKAVYLDPIVADIRKKALELSGVQR